MTKLFYYQKLVSVLIFFQITVNYQKECNKNCVTTPLNDSLLSKNYSINAEKGFGKYHWSNKRENMKNGPIAKFDY